MSMKLSFNRLIAFSAGIATFAATCSAETKYEQNIDKSFAVEPGGRLEVSADMGGIHVTTGADDKLVIHVLQRVVGGDQNAADEVFSRHEVTFTQKGNTVSVVAKRKNSDASFWNFRNQSFEVAYEITAPKRYEMKLTTAGGDIVMEDLDGKLDARTSSGAIRAGVISGALTARNAGGDVIVKEAGGDVQVATSSGAVELQKAGGKVDASNAGGDIRLGEVGGGVAARTSSGSITIAGATGSVDATDAGGDIRITRAGGKVLAHTSGGSVTVGTADGDVTATDAGGDIQIDAAGGNAAADTSSGRIEIGTVKGKRAKAENHGGNIEIRDAAGDVEAKTSSGSIKVGTAAGMVNAWNSGGDVAIDNARNGALVRTSSGSIRIGASAGKLDLRDAGGNINVSEAGHAVNAETSSGTIDVLFLIASAEDSRFVVSGGSINVSVPADAHLDLNAESLGGVVKSELPVTIQGRARDGELLGRLNGGGPKLTLHCSSGDIHLKRAPAGQARADSVSAH